MSESYLFRAEPGEMFTFKEAARKARLPFSEWLRQAARNQAKHQQIEYLRMPPKIEAVEDDPDILAFSYNNTTEQSGDALTDLKKLQEPQPYQAPVGPAVVPHTKRTFKPDPKPTRKKK